ncbi:hypothetical protein E4H12_02815 [Candidatus Thorarchaeota archaeon]|nr:MAG: hypothetical protein E4H12_02815 [Candidatus Thorarchaeota archaeon]
MAILGTLTGSRYITFVAIFAAMIAILDSIPMIPGFYGGIWDSWGFMLSPIIGILLGPLLGPISVGLGGLVGHLIYFRDPLELLFMLGAPVGAGIAGLVYQQRWNYVFAIYSLLLLGYFITPVTWVLSLWGIWDVLVAFTLVLGLTALSNFKKSTGGVLDSTTVRLALGTAIGLEADILVRIFILIPGQVWWFFYGLPVEELQLMWLVAGFITPIKVILAAIATVAIGKSLLHNFQNHTHDSDNQLTME